MSFEAIKNKVGQYYSGKLKEFGATPKGVDWNNQESQVLRFEQLVRVMDGARAPASVLDYGCGYGSLYEFVQERFPGFRYTGFDISAGMIGMAEKKYPAGATWTSSLASGHVFDYVLASGIFNVRLNTKNEDWLGYIL